MEVTDTLADELSGELVMSDAVEIAKVKNASSAEKKKETSTVIEGMQLYNLIDVNNEITQLVPGTAPSLMLSSRIKKLDLVEALKGVE